MGTVRLTVRIAWPSLEACIPAAVVPKPCSHHPPTHLLACPAACSLNPGVDRLAFSVVWDMDEEGNIQ